ncbi:LOW QUALITY PROTEIN: hypothetical protein HID58_055258, partial [Brassica napus]
MEQTLVDAISKINQRAVAQEPGCPLPYISHTVITKGTCLHHSPMSVPKTNINRIHTITKIYHHPHQSHGGGHNQEHMNLPRNFNGLGGFVRPSPPLLVPKFMLNICQLNHFINLWILQNIDFVFYFMSFFSDAYVSLLRLSTTDDVSSSLHALHGASSC